MRAHAGSLVVTDKRQDDEVGLAALERINRAHDAVAVADRAELLEVRELVIQQRRNAGMELVDLRLIL